MSTPVLGLQEQPPARSAGTLSGHPLPARGPAGGRAAATIQSQINLDPQVRAIRQAQRNVKAHIQALEKQIGDLEARGIPDSQPWLSFERAASFEDWVAKCKARMAKPVSLHDALKEDIETLRTNLKDLQFQLRRAGPGALHRSAAAETRQFTRDFIGMIRLAKQHDGVLDAHLIEVIRADARRGIDKWKAALDADPSDENIKGLLSLIRTTQLVGLNDENGDTAALLSFGNAVNRRRTMAEQDFRRRPTGDRFKKYISWVRTQLLLGTEADAAMSPPAQRLHRGESSYTVQKGDSLSSISKRFYGSEGYWDVIVFANLGMMRGTAEQLEPGLVLQIP